MKFLFFCIVYLSCSLTAIAKLSHPLSPEQLTTMATPEIVQSYLEHFKNRASRLSRMNSPGLDVSDLKIGNKYFLPMSNLISAGQPNIDVANSVVKLLQAIDEGWVKWNGDTYELTTNSSTSVFPEENCGKGVVVGDRVLLHDGHSKAMASFYLGAEQYCIEIVDSFPNLSLDNPETWSLLEDKGYLLLLNHLGEKLSQLPSWETIEDFPLRSVLVAHRMKADAEFSEAGKLKEVDIKNGDPKTAVFFKVNKHPPFVEMLLSIVAQLGGYELPEQFDPAQYEPSKSNTNYLIHSIERGLSSGHPAIAELSSIILRVPLSPHHKQFKSQSDIEEFLQAHYEKLKCHEKLSP